MASLRQQYYKSYIEFKQSDAFKSLSAEERAQINKTAKETYKQLSDNEAPMLEGQELRDQRGVLSNVVTDLTAGMVNLGRAGVSGAAWAADAAGFPDAARTLDEKSQQMGETSQMISPPADPNRLVDFGSQALAQNAPTLAAGGILARLLTGSAAGGAILNNVRNAAGIPAIAGAAPLSEGAASFLSTTGLYGIPAARQANVEADGEIRAGNPYFELAAAVPYALIENTLGITPLKTMRAFSGGAAPAGVAKTIAASAGKLGELLEKPLFELSGKAGIRGTVGAFSRFVAENILGESTEEVLQAIEETAIPHFAKKSIGQAIRDTMTDLGKPEVVDLLTQAKGGALVGGVLGGGNSIARKITSISAQINDPKTTPEEAQKLAAAKKQLKDEMLQLTYNQNTPTVQPSGPVITDPTVESSLEPEGELIHPQQTFGGPAPEVLYPDAQPPQNIGTEGTMRDYAAYQQDKQATREEQNATPMAVLRKYTAMRKLPDSNPEKQRFMKFVAERNYTLPETIEYPAGEVGKQLQALDDAEVMQQPLVSAEAEPETPLLPYQQNQAEGRILADNGGVVLPVKTEDFVMPKSGRPFANQKIARAYQTKNSMKDTHDITPVRGGFALMRKPTQQQNVRRVAVETPRGGAYEKLDVRTEKNIPTENRTRFTGTPGVAERIEKRLTPQAIATEEFADQATIKQPAPVAEPKAPESQTKATEPVKQPAAPAYKVESYQGGFRVLDTQGKQYSWHTSKQAAEAKAAVLNNGKKEADKPAGVDVKDLPAIELPEWLAKDETARRLAAATGKIIDVNMDIGRGTIEKILPSSQKYPNGSVIIKAFDRYEGKKRIAGQRDTFDFVFLRDRIKRGESRLLGRDGLPEEVAAPAEEADKPAAPAPKLEAWETPLPTTGKAAAKTDRDTINSVVDDAKAAITPDQKKAMAVGQDKFKLYVLPGTETSAGAIRFIPETQSVPAAWKQIDGFKDTYRLGNMTDAQTTDLLTRFAWRAPILQVVKTTTPAGEAEEGEGRSIYFYQPIPRSAPNSSMIEKGAMRESETGSVSNGKFVIFGKHAPEKLKALAADPKNKAPNERIVKARWEEEIKERAAKDANIDLDYAFTVDKAFRENQILTDIEAVKKSSMSPSAKKRSISDLRKELATLENIVVLRVDDGYTRSFTSIPESNYNYFMKTFPGAKLKSEIRRKGDSAKIVSLVSKDGDTIAIVMPFSELPRQMTDDEAAKLMNQLAGKPATATPKAMPAPKKAAPTAIAPTPAVAPLTIAETTIERSKYESDIPISAAINAHRGTSFSPEKRGESERKAYADHLESARKRMFDLAKTDEQKKIAEEEFERYRAGYRQRYVSILSTKSRTMSPMITGPAKFPVSRNNKALDAEMNKYNELKEWRDKAMRSALKKIAPHRFAVSSDQENAVELLQKKLAGAEKLQQLMVDMNKIVKSKKLSDSDKIAQMVATGRINETNAKKLLVPDFGGRIGFAAYQLQNNSAEIRRLKQRINDLRARKADKTTETVFDGGKIVDSVEDNRVQIFFDTKPDADTISKLKAAAFKWAPSIGAWQRMRGPDASRRAADIVGVETKKAEPAASKKPIYSAEYLVAKYAAQGLKQAAKIVRAGVNAFRSGLTQFAKWARQMVNEFGQAVKKHLRSLFKDLSDFNKRLGRTGAISGRPASTVTGKTTGQVLERIAKMKDFQWKKENFRTVNLEYTSPDTGKVTRVAKLLKVNNKWFWTDTNREFLTLATAAKTVKSEIFEKVRNTEREQVKIIEEARARRTAKQAKATKKVEAYLSQPTAAEEVTKKELPVTVADKISTYADRVTRALFDRRLMLKKVQKLIELVSGKPLPDWANPYDRFDVIDGRIETNKGEFKDKYWQPIMADLDKAKISYEDFNNFVYAMHAPERNKYINEINPGFREKKVPGSGWSDEKAAQVKKELFAKHGEDTLMEAGKKFWAMHSELLNKQVEYGLIDEEIKGIIDAKYKYYTPLKRIKDDTVILDARALGRRSEAQDQLMFSLAAIDTTFGRGEHNRVMQAFARMALLNPADQFYEIQKDKLKPYFDERTGEVQYRLDLWADRESTVHAKFDGRDVAIVIKDKDLLNAIKTKSSEAEPLFQLLRPINRILSAVNTAFNPDFILTNIFRDIQTAAVHASDAESWEMAKGILASVPGSVKTSWQHHRGIDNENTRMYKEFLREGGKTGYSEIYQLQNLAEKLEKEMAERQANGAWYKTKQGIGRFMDTVAAGNDIAESATRFAGYQAARKSGMTAQKAAAFAKNLTINFNKKGTYGTIVNTAYVFGNAALQGSHLTARLTWNMAKTNKGRIALASMIALGAMSDFLNRLISDFDDEEGRSYYDKISSDIKDNNFIVMLPGTGGNYMSFPMAYGLNILPSLGRNASSYLFGDQTLRETGNNILGTGLAAFNPMGNDNRGLLFNIIPSVARPFFDVKTNSKWSGRKIKPDQPVFGAELPQSELYFDQTSKPLIRFTKWLNEIAGGNKYESSSILTDISPADMQHLLETFTGGVGKTIVRGVDTIGRVASGKPVQVENVPVIRRFVGKARDFNVYDEFRANAQIAKRVQAAKGDDDKEWLNNNRESVRVNVLFKNVQKAILALRKNKSLSDETRKEKELLLQKRFNKNVREIMQKNLSKN